MATGTNHLLDLLPARELSRLLSQCEAVPLRLGEVLSEFGAPARHVHFPIDGFISLIAQTEGHQSLEVGMVGREGMVGASLVLGVAIDPLRAMVQGTGTAWRLGAAPFLRELAGSAAMQRYLRRYIYVLMAQRVASAGCLRFHLIGPRLARWLLMSHDRAQADCFHVTHEFLACMLGVRRVGVTVAAGALQRAGLIHYHRGELTVVDRPGLEAAACGCYEADRRVYAEQMP